MILTRQSPVMETVAFTVRYALSCTSLNNPQHCKIIKGKAVPLQAWSGPEGSRKLRVPDFVTTAQDGGKVVTLRTGRLCSQETLLVLISVRG